MASISISGWPGSGGRYYTLEVWEISYDPITNISKCGYNLSANGDSSIWYSYYLYAAINGTPIFSESGDWSKGAFPAKVGSISGTMNIGHGSDGKKSISLYIEGYAYTYSTYSNSTTMALTNGDRNAPAITLAQISNIGTNSFTISASANDNCDIWEYTLNGGSSWTRFSTTNAKSASTTITGLATNTSYTVYVRARRTYNQVYGTSGAQSAKTLGLSPITSAADTELGHAVNVKWTPLDTSFKFKIKFECGTWNYESDFISPGSTSQQTYTGYTLPINELAQNIIGSADGEIKVTLTTFTSAGTQIGTDSKIMMAHVPDDIVPTIDDIVLEEGEESGFGTFVRAISTLKATISASGTLGSVITAKKLEIEGRKYDAKNDVAESNLLVSEGTVTATIFVIDSRGRIAQAQRDINVYDYNKPTLQLEVYVSGTTVGVTAKGNISPVGNLNQRHLVIHRKRVEDGGNTETYTAVLSSYVINETWIQTIEDVQTDTYEYTAELSDTVNEITATILTGVTAISRLGGGKGVTLFGEALEEGFDMWLDEGSIANHSMTKAHWEELYDLLDLEPDIVGDNIKKYKLFTVLDKLAEVATGITRATLTTSDGAPLQTANEETIIVEFNE